MWMKTSSKLLLFSRRKTNLFALAIASIGIRQIEVNDNKNMSVCRNDTIMMLAANYIVKQDLLLYYE